MLRHIDSNACANRWRTHSGAVAVFCCGLMLCAVLGPPWPGAPLVFVVAFTAAVAGARVPAGTYSRALLWPLGFVATSAVGLCFSINWHHGWHIAYNPTGAQTALCAGLRALAALSVTLLFAFTVPTPSWLTMLRRLRVPEALLDLILLTYRTIFLLDNGQTAILRAQRNRLGYRDARRSLHSCGLAVSALFIRAITHSQRLERGLAARNYTGRLVVLMPPSATRSRHMLLALAIPALIGAAVWFVSAFHFST